MLMNHLKKGNVDSVKLTENNNIWMDIERTDLCEALLNLFYPLWLFCLFHVEFYTQTQHYLSLIIIVIFYN